MRILVACEESQAVCIEMRKRGHEAYSCDILPCSGGHPEWHIKGDVLDLLSFNIIYDKPNIYFETCNGKGHLIEQWDMIIAFPPCTFLPPRLWRH